MSGAMQFARDNDEQLTPAEEEQARANVYGLLARLWYAAPDQQLLETFSRSGRAADATDDVGDTRLAQTWRALARACAEATVENVTHEYDSLFIGTGSAEITLYCSYYLTETGRERVLVALRDELRTLGLARTHATSEPEDHFAALLEVMRHLIVQRTYDAQITLQKEFFLRYIRSAYVPLAEAVLANGGAHFYKDVAHLTRAFLDVESESFNMI
ncbi:MAG: molecular chaperone TorD family protein [Burkholderiales bacterium]